MLMMENAEEVLQALERFTKLKQNQIPRELEDYLCFVAKTGDTIFRWSVIKALFREKLISVIKQFHEQTAIDDLPHYPNVDPFNYETMKTALLERLDSFGAAPFTIQRICELLTDPRKQYSRIDKFMRAIEKNILVVSTTEPGRPKSLADSSDYSDSLDSMVNGSNVTGVGSALDDLAGDIDVDIELENGATSTIAVAAVDGTGQTAALPSINTLNSALLAANNGNSSVTAIVPSADDLLGHHHHHGLVGDEEVDDEDDDEDIVHNHLTTDPTDGGVLVESSVTEEVGLSVAASVVGELIQSPGKKRVEDEDVPEEGAESAKRVKLDGASEEEEQTVTKEIVPEAGDNEEDKETTAPEIEAIEKEPKDLKLEVEVVGVEKEEEKMVEIPKETTVDPLVAEEEQKKDELEENKEPTDEIVTPTQEQNEAITAIETKIDDASSTPSTETVPLPSEPISEAAIPEASLVEEEKEESLSPEAMDVKAIESIDAMEAETVAEAEMEVDSGETTAVLGTSTIPGIVSEESVSMDEPMEDQ